jgi:hypothetical protein
MLPDSSEWNEQLLKECMYPHNVNEVLKIRLSERIQDDHIAWFYERSGVFTVKSAYKLAVEAERDEESHAGSSARTNGSRPLYGGDMVSQCSFKGPYFCMASVAG